MCHMEVIIPKWVDFCRERVASSSSICPEEVRFMRHRNIETGRDLGNEFHGVRFHDFITTVEKDADGAILAATFEVLRKPQSVTVRRSRGTVKDDKALDEALEAVFLHNQLKSLFDTERDKGEESDVWRLQTLRKVVKKAHEDLPEDLQP